MQKEPDSGLIRIFTLIKKIFFFLLRPLSHLETNFFVFFAYFCSKNIQKYCFKTIFRNLKYLQRNSNFRDATSTATLYKPKMLNAFSSKPKVLNFW